MAKYRNNLPQLNGGLFLTDSGLETTLIFIDGFDLPEFAAFTLLKTDKGHRQLRKYFEAHAAIAREYNTGFILESMTWRASAGWGDKLNLSGRELAEMNHKAIELLDEVRNNNESEKTRIAISGCIGSREDGYSPAGKMNEEEAENYHSTQIKTLSETNADFISALTMTNTDEAVGLTRAARSSEMPVVISFTVETDGRLPSGQPLKEAVETVDQATDSAPVYYMINCAHPTHFETALPVGEPWVQRIRGIRANASVKSHAELDEAEELDDGNPFELARQYKDLTDKFPQINVLGGCCGTDHRHIREICRLCAPH